jgi:hypothetical protein
MSYGKQETTERSLHRKLFFNPVRPSGLGQMKIGTAGDFALSGGGGWRRLKVTHSPADGSTTFNYHGAIPLPGQPNRCGDFMASEKVDSTQRLILAWVSYGTPAEQTFPCPGVGFVTIRDIVNVRSEFHDRSTGYLTTVTTARGDRYKFVTSPEGIVTLYEYAVPYQCA